MESRLYIYIGLLTVFIATFSIFFIFFNIEKMLRVCKADPTYSPVCKQLNGFTVTVLIILLVVGGFVIIISVTGYILISATL